MLLRRWIRDGRSVGDLLGDIGIEEVLVAGESSC